MKHLILVLSILSITYAGRTQNKEQLKFKGYYVQVNSRPFERVIASGIISVDTINKKISITGVKGVDFKYKESWKDNYFHYYMNTEVGELFIAEDKAYARLELTNGTDVMLEFHNLKK